MIYLVSPPSSVTEGVATGGEVTKEEKVASNHVIRVHDWFFHKGDDPYVWVKMDQYKGSLLDYLIARRNDPLNVFEIVSLMIQLLSALVLCHSKNLIHRDIKLENGIFFLVLR